MAEPFKNLINASTVQHASRQLRRVWPAFEHDRFVRLASTGLDALELKARAMHLCDALEATLPADFGSAATLIESSLAPPLPDGELSASGAPDHGLAGWIVWPLGEFVARRGLATPQRALTTLHALTQRFSAEWAIRPFIEAHPDLVFATLAAWTQDPSAHVRRLVSEGSRPRLPWGLQLKGLIRDPSPTLPLLRTLQHDPSEYVRRSVANHLNDIAKDHPQQVVQWVVTELPQAAPPLRALLRHASRTLIKRGDAGMLKAWGLGARFKGETRLSLSAQRVPIGESFAIEVVLRSTSPRPQKLAIDYAVHHVKANGATTPKVFKGWLIDLGPHASRRLVKHHSMRPITTRRYHPGRHEVDVRVNGELLARVAFDLVQPAG